MAEAPRIATECLPATPEAIRCGAQILRCGGLVAFPTETVYGLGADADNPAAVRSVFIAKGRPADHPVIVHLAEATDVEQWATHVPQQARALADAFWPGPMTLILRRSRRASDLVTGGLETIGLRVPGHPIAQALLREFGGAIAAPSANRFGRVSPTRASHVMEELAGRVSLVLDGGPCDIGLESTIIDLSGASPALLRPGGITAEQIAAVLGRAIAGASSESPPAPGSMSSHYAPRARVELVPESKLIEHAAMLAEAGESVAVLSQMAMVTPPGVTHLPLPSQPALMAQVLYEMLRRVDELGLDVAVTSVPDAAGLGLAIGDRLQKAAGPRSAGG
jgi:L-threonylcarbamoyladenylate synthase